MSDPIFELEVWPEGITQARIPANDNALRLEALARPCLGTSNNPGASADGDVYLVGSSPAGSFSTFSHNDIAIYRDGTWYAWAPVEGTRLVVADVRKVYTAGSTASWDTDPSVPLSSNRFVNIALSDMTTDLVAGNNKGIWFAPESGTFVTAYIGVYDPSSSGVVRVDMNKNGGSSIFSTRPSIDATENTSLTGTAAVFSGTQTFVRGDRYTFDIDDAGTDAKGLQICIEYSA